MAPDTKDKGDPASPVCYMSESDPAYAGYLGRAEIASELRRLMARIEDDRLHAKLMKIVRELEAPCPKD